MYVNPYLSFDGTTEEAFNFYAKVLGGGITLIQRYGEVPGCEGMSDKDKGKAMHARFESGKVVLLATDSTPDHPYEGIKGMSVALQVDTPEDAERIFAGLAEGAKEIEMPIMQTFWSTRFGMLTDHYNIRWMVNCVQEPPKA